MLPREMLTVRRRGEHVVPVLAPVDEEHLDVARGLIGAFAAHVGRPRLELDEDLQRRELRLETRFKLARGLAALLERRCRFEVSSPVDPAAARRLAYDACAALEGGAATTPEARARVLAEAARLLGATPAEVETALAADSDDAMVLAAFDAPDPERLLRRYNLALAQTLLFDATRVEVEIREGFRPFLGLVKMNGLMHQVARDEDGTHRIVLDGPASLFADTRRYGAAIAKVLPGLARAGAWRLRATIREKNDPKERLFEATHETLPIPFEPEEVSYDSDVERRFAQGWASLRSPWRLQREPAAIQLPDGSLFVPDFGFAWRDGVVRAHLEIVGYWTPAYLARKLAKLRRLPPGARLLVAVDESLGVGEDALADAPADLLAYKGDVPLVRVLRWLDALEAHLVEDEAARLLAAPPMRDAPVLTLAGIAREAGVSHAAVERALPKLDLGERVRLGDALARPAVVDDLAARLAPGMRVSEVEALARAVGVEDSASLLAHLGFAAAWQGLDPSSAVIRRRGG